MSVQTLNISLPKELVERTDAIAKETYKSRSELIRDALRAYVDRAERWDDIFEEGRKIGKRMGVTSEDDVLKIIEDYRREKRQTSNRS